MKHPVISKNVFKLIKKTAPYLVSILLLFVVGAHSKAQALSIRKTLNRINSNISIGYSGTQLQRKLHLPVILKAGNIYLDKDNQLNPEWFINLDSEASTKSGEFENSAEAHKGKVGYPLAHSFLHGTIIEPELYIEIDKKLRLGLGLICSINLVRELEVLIVDSHEKTQKSIIHKPENPRQYSLTPFASIGYKLFQNNYMSAILDFRFGLPYYYFNLKGKLIEKFTLPHSIGSQSIGLTLEKHISDYFRLTCRFAYNTLSNSRVMKIYQMKSPVLTNMHSLSMQIGISINTPEIPRCNLYRCSIVCKHSHRGQFYRGASMFVGKNKRSEYMYKK